MRAFQAVDLITSPQLGEVYADIYNTIEDIESAGYSPTSDLDQYGYRIYHYSGLEKPYWKQDYAIVVPV